jgi:hypothetical protein
MDRNTETTEEAHITQSRVGYLWRQTPHIQNPQNTKQENNQKQRKIPGGGKRAKAWEQGKKLWDTYSCLREEEDDRPTPTKVRTRTRECRPGRNGDAKKWKSMKRREQEARERRRRRRRQLWRLGFHVFYPLMVQISSISCGFIFHPSTCCRGPLYPYESGY